MKTTNASAIGTFFNIQSDDTDEIDWQWNGNQSFANAVYYSRGVLHNATNPNSFSVNSPHDTFHCTSSLTSSNVAYTLDWSQDRIEWIIDGVTVATLKNNGIGYPQTPAQVNIGIWCPNCYPGQTPISPNGSLVTSNLDTYVATLSALEIINYNPADQYSYRDTSGTSSSVIMINTSTSKLRATTIAGIAIGAAAGLGIIVGALVLWFVRRRKKHFSDNMQPNEIIEIPCAKTRTGEIGENASETGSPDARPLRYPEDSDTRPEGRLEQPYGARLGTSFNVDTPLGGRLGMSLDLDTHIGGRLGQPDGPRLGTTLD